MNPLVSMNKLSIMTALRKAFDLSAILSETFQSAAMSATDRMYMPSGTGQPCGELVQSATTDEVLFPVAIPVATRSQHFETSNTTALYDRSVTPLLHVNP